MKINSPKKIHFVGIGGIGISATAKLMALKGKTVSGSDCQTSEIIKDLESVGVKIFTGHNEKNLSSNADLIVHSLAIPLKNPELLKAKKLKIPTLTYPEFLGALMKNKFGIAVAGTHGKSTTTAMTGFILERAGFDTTVIIGSKLKAFGGNIRPGKSKHFVAEADEYKRAFLNLFPKIAVITNIEKDHLDYYKNLEDIISAFKEFASQTEETLIVNGDDRNILKIVENLKKKEVLTFGQRVGVDLRATNITVSNAATNFKATFKGKALGRFRLRLPGTFNVYNALGAIGAALYLGAPIAKIKKGLSEFSGLWRRFEQVGEYKGAVIISDYAHHPTACKFTIEATKKFFPAKRIVAVFQPHQHSRTKKLFKDFTAAFDEADLVILSEIFDVAGRENSDQDISSRDLSQVIEKRGKKVFYGRNLEKTKDLILENIKANDVVLIMGAGDIFKLANELASLNAKCKIKELNVKKNILLAPYTTFHIGGPAEYFYEAKSDEDIIRAVKTAQKLNIPYFILGGGSNILVSDKGFKGLVIKIQNTKYKIQNTRIASGAGVKLSKLVDSTLKNNLSGLEWAAGIPGTVGGAVRGNAGAFSGSMSEIVKFVKVLRGKNIKQLASKDLKFTYRNSIFKHNKDIILSTELQLKKGSQAEIKKQIKKNLQHRRENQPIKALSAGCIFKNTRTKLNKPAAQLIEEADLKGKQIGGAMVSKKHTNFIINTGKAKAEDVVILISLIKARVRNKSGVQLQEEVQYVGF